MSQVFKKFEEKIDELKSMSDKLADGILGKDSAPWSISELEGEPTKFDREAAHDEFDRKEIEDEYKAGFRQSDPAPIGTQGVLKIQSDFLSALERDFSLRHKSRLRCFAHDAGRRSGIAHDNGVLQSLVVAYVQNILQTVQSNIEKSVTVDGSINT